MGNSYAERVQRDRQRYLDIGLDSGAQIVHDMLCVALRDKQAMGDDVWGKERIVRLQQTKSELADQVVGAGGISLASLDADDLYELLQG